MLPSITLVTTPTIASLLFNSVYKLQLHTNGFFRSKLYKWTPPSSLLAPVPKWQRFLPEDGVVNTYRHLLRFSVSLFLGSLCQGASVRTHEKWYPEIDKSRFPVILEIG